MSTLGCRARRFDANAARDRRIGSSMSASPRSRIPLALTGGPEGGGTGGRIGGGVPGGSGPGGGVPGGSVPPGRVTIVFSMNVCSSVVGPDLLLPGKGVGGGVGGGVVGTGGGVVNGTVADVNVAMGGLITVCLASASAPATFGRPLGGPPGLAGARMAALRIPGLPTPPITVAKLLAATLTPWGPTARATGP